MRMAFEKARHNGLWLESDRSVREGRPFRPRCTPRGSISNNAPPGPCNHNGHCSGQQLALVDQHNPPRTCLSTGRPFFPLVAFAKPLV